MKTNKKYKNFPPSLEKSPWIVTDETGAEYGTKSFKTTEYLYVRVNGIIDVQIKTEDEGVVVDLYPLHPVDEPVNTTYGMWGDDPDYDDDKFNELSNNPLVSDVFGKVYKTKEFHSKEVKNNVICIFIKNLLIQLEYDLNKDFLRIYIFPNTKIEKEYKPIASIKALLKDFVVVTN